MEGENLDSIELTANDAARAINVSYRTLLYWLDSGDLEGRETLTHRRFTTVGALRRFLATRGAAGQEALPGLEEYIQRYVVPKIEKGGTKISTKVLSLA